MTEQLNGQLSNASPTILVVDDEVAIVKLCKALLEGSGFTVLEAGNSDEALKTCTQHRGAIDLLLTDLVLSPLSFQLGSTANQFPKMQGHELAIRASMIRSDLRIILMSGNPDQTLANYGINRGTFPFLAKPFERAHLIATVQQVLSQPAPTLAADIESSANGSELTGWVQH